MHKSAQHELLFRFSLSFLQLAAACQLCAAVLYVRDNDTGEGAVGCGLTKLFFER